MPLAPPGLLLQEEHHRVASQGKDSHEQRGKESSEERVHAAIVRGSSDDHGHERDAFPT